jgi:hypothetical protein
MGCGSAALGNPWSKSSGSLHIGGASARCLYRERFSREFVTEADYIGALKARWPQGRTASREVLSLAAEAVRDFPQSATLWFLRGQLIWMAPPDYIFSRLDAVCSFEEAIRLDPSLTDAYERLGHSRGKRDDGERDPKNYGKEAKQRGKPSRED